MHRQRLLPRQFIMGHFKHFTKWKNPFGNVGTLGTLFYNPFYKTPSHKNTFKTAFQTFQCSKLYNYILLNNKKQCILFYLYSILPKWNIIREYGRNPLWDAGTRGTLFYNYPYKYPPQENTLKIASHASHASHYIT